MASSTVVLKLSLFLYNQPSPVPAAKPPIKRGLENLEIVDRPVANPRLLPNQNRNNKNVKP